MAEPMEVKVKVDGSWSAGRISDMSVLGMFVETTYPPPEGSQVEFHFVIPGTPSNTPVEGIGRVVWTSQNVGAGLTFERLLADGRERIRLFVATRLPR